jgi:hypothetical protein
VHTDYSEPELNGDSRVQVATKLHSAGRRVSFDDLDGLVLEFRRYPGCSAGSFISVGFNNGGAYTKSYYG